MSITVLSITQKILRGNSPNKRGEWILAFVENVDNVDKDRDKLCKKM